jgi:hypothetical protein
MSAGSVHCDMSRENRNMLKVLVLQKNEAIALERDLSRHRRTFWEVSHSWVSGALTSRRFVEGAL